ncbi:restriction endonuclease subunit S [Aliarcobacter sp. ERUVET-8]|uniref:restriction endonuclease subunit S n=1 Tax=Aliarcobacter sp. ERUVET-8 TaxID=3429684 RepID=UPI003D6A74B1
MKSNYKKLGYYIAPAGELNIGMQVDNLLGISNAKYFQKAKTNTIGINLETYRIVRKGQFAFNRATTRNGDKISIALRYESDCIVSPSYRIFEVVKTDELLPEYLMMWFRRPEFDRYARYKSHGSAHEFFEYNEMCEIELPIPSIEKQKEIIKEYHTITDRIKLNEQLNQKLEDTAQSIYKEWFVNFEFPDENGKPYKSNGGEMVYCEELEMEIPKGWIRLSLEEVCTLITKGTTPQNMFDKKFDSSVNYLKAESINMFHGIDEKKLSFIEEDTHLKELKRSILKENDLLFSIAGTLGKFSKVYKKILPANINQAIAIIRVNQDKISLNYIEGLFLSGWHNEFYRDNVQQAVQENLSLTTIKALPILIPCNSVLEKINLVMKSIQKTFEQTNKENQMLIELKEVLLSKIATVEG